MPRTGGGHGASFRACTEARERGLGKTARVRYLPRQRPVAQASEHARKHRSWRAIAIVLGVAGLALSGCTTVREFSARANATPLADPAEAAALSDAEIDRRLEFLTARLDAGRRHAALWQYGWLGVNAVGGIAPAVQAGFDDGTDRDYDIIEASKGAIGVTYLLVAPMPGRHGADLIRAMPDATHADRAARLLEAERTLHETALRSEQRKQWLVHLGNLGLNLAGGIALFALGDPEKAGLSIGVDTAVGEVQILTQPWKPEKDWADYRAFVETGHASAVPTARSWHVVPARRGLALAVDF